MEKNLKFFHLSNEDMELDLLCYNPNMDTKSIKVVFMGSPDFSLETLRQLNDNYDVVGVVTQPSKPAGRGNKMRDPAVKVLADELGLPVIQPKRVREAEAMDQLRAWAPEVIVVAAYGQILRQELLDLPPHGCINVHGSLLPRWRGASPIQAAVAYGDDVTGVTIMKMDAGMDTGDMLRKREVPIEADDTAGTVFDKLAVVGAELLIDTLSDYLAGKITPEKQDDALVTMAPMIKKEDGLLDFSKPAEALEAWVRGMAPWPGAYFVWQEKMIKVHGASAVPGDYEIGAHLVFEKKPAVGTADGLLVLNEVQPAGKKRMAGDVFLNGARDWVAE